MCGIAGIARFDGRPIDPQEIESMCALLHHRGPDDHGYYFGEGIALGHRRLSIIDLSEAGRQPMCNEDKTLWLVFNGEVYNYLELRERLEGLGHCFSSRTDSEVVLHAYEEFGVELASQLNGMYGFAIWDSRRRRLFCLRDRFGIKPLYYLEAGGAFYFASEIKALVMLKSELRRPDWRNIYRFVLAGALDDTEGTLFAAVKSLPPAHFLILDEGGLRTRRYWKHDREEFAGKYDYSHPEASLRALLEDSVRLQLQSEVPVGTCLSGGIDSSTVVAMAAALSPNPVRTFTATYKGTEHDESAFAGLVASRFGTDAVEVCPDGARLLELLPRIVWHLDEPCASPGVFSQWHVMEAAARKVKVLLDGQGGDELFGGYFHYFPAYLRTRFRELPRSPSVGALRSLFRDLGEIAGLMELNPFVLLVRSLYPLSLRTFYQRLRLRRFLNPDFEKGVLAELGERPSLPNAPALIDDTLLSSFAYQSLPALLHYEDRTSAAFSIEARVPFLDHRVVEFALGLPYQWKISGSETKVVLRRAVSDLLPQEIVGRRDKKGYPTPVGDWFRTVQRREVRELLSAPSAEFGMVFDRRAVLGGLDDFQQGRRDLAVEIWQWVMMELWFNVFVNGTMGHEVSGAAPRRVSAGQMGTLP